MKRVRSYRRGFSHDRLTILADETSPRFPPQLYEIIENFCLGTRRLELFGSKSKARKGWVTLGDDDTDVKTGVQEYTPERYSEILLQNVDPLGRNVLPQVEDKSGRTNLDRVD